MQIELPGNVRYIINKLYAAGFEAYAVGGCVRDSLMGRTPKDWDVTTSATPESVMEIFSKDRIFPSGLKHGTVTIVLGGTNYEVTTYRVDGLYTDGRRPDSVSFTGDLREDLSRRDFTVNAMAYNDRAGLVDSFGGRRDIEQRLIRCVGDAETRFSEDYLRMLRAYRFSCVLGFTMHESVLAACRANAAKIKDISAERIREEFEKILCGSDFSGIELFLRDFSAVLFPEVYRLIGLAQNTKYHSFDVFGHTLAVISKSEANRVMRLTALLHDTGKAFAKTTDAKGRDHFYGHEPLSAKIAGEVLLRLKYDNKTIDAVCSAVKYHGATKNLNRAGIRKLIFKAGREGAKNVLEFAVADLLGKSEYIRELDLPKALGRIEIYNDICEKNEPCEIKALKITGNDIMELSPYARGKLVGTVLNELMELVLERPELNERDALLEIADRALTRYVTGGI